MVFSSGSKTLALALALELTLALELALEQELALVLAPEYEIALALGRKGKLQSFCIPTACECIKFKFVLPVSFECPPPHIVTTTKAAFIFEQTNDS